MFKLESLLRSNLHDKYFCPKCHLILRNPMQFPCGHRCCQSCMIIGERSASIECSECHAKTQPNQIFPDRGFQRDMQQLMINCRRCPWTGRVVCFQAHYDNDHDLSSSNRLVSCALFPAGCDEQIRQKDLGKHYLSVEHQLALAKMIAGRVKNPTDQRARNVQVFATDPMRTNRTMQETSETIKTSVEETSSDDLALADGLSLWEIKQIESKLGHSQSDIFASTFCTTPSGHRLRLSLKIDRSSGTLSISLNLIHGEHDAILHWPFSFQMAFSLCHLGRDQNDFLVSFQPDQRSMSFEGPQSGMTIGCFIPLAKLEQQNSPYIVDDSIFIKILFIKDPVPIDLLPSLMSINPALPVHLQKVLIEQKRKRKV